MIGPVAATQAAADRCPPLEPKEWVTIEVPAFPEGDQIITDYAVSRVDPRLIYVTNGNSVFSSTDGGCTFEQSFSLEAADLSYQVGAGITDLHLASDDGKKVYLAVEGREMLELVAGQSQDLGPRPHVIVTNDGGATWVESDTGLERAVGPPLALAATPGSNTAYLLVDENEVRHQGVRVTQPQTLYSTTSGGASWTKRWEFGDPVAVEGVAPETDDALGPPPRLTKMLADPVAEEDVWLYGERGLFRSTDGGTTVTEMTLAATTGGGIAEVEIFHEPDAPAQMLVFPSDQPVGYFINDTSLLVGGLAGEQFDTPDVMTSAALTSGFRFGVGSVGGDAFYYHPGAVEPYDISPAGQIVHEIQRVASNGEELLYGRSQTALLRRLIPPPPPPIVPNVPGVPKPSYEPVTDLPGLDDLEDPKLLPTRQEVELEPGETRVLPYRLLLPGVISADVAFLVDVSDSMTEEINGLRGAIEKIIENLSDSGIQAYFGVARYRAYDRPPAYERLQDINPPDDPGLVEALNSLEASGGGKETQLAALYQLATGAGQNDKGAIIAPQQEMNFRENSLHVVVHGTDENFTVNPPNPTFEQAASALNGVDARQVGLSYENEQTVPPSTTDGNATIALGKIASNTGALAPDGGVDCNDDDQPDIQPGLPLVCAIPSGNAGQMQTSIGTAIVKLVESLPDSRRVELEVKGEIGVLDGVEPPVYTGVDFKLAQGLFFDVSVTCPRTGFDRDYEIKPTATARGIPIATAELKVICRAEPLIRNQELRVPPPLVFAPPGRPPPPPQAPRVPNPIQQIQAQTQSQSQAQAQAGLVTQRQSQPQVAAVKVMKPSANLARADGGPEDLEFSSYKRSKHGGLPPYLPSYVVAAAMGAAFGLVMRRQTRRAFVSVTRQRR